MKKGCYSRKRSPQGITLVAIQAHARTFVFSGGSTQQSPVTRPVESMSHVTGFNSSEKKVFINIRYFFFVCTLLRNH